MALINHEMFTKIDIQECLKKSFTIPEQSPTFTNITNKFNQVFYKIFILSF